MPAHWIDLDGAANVRDLAGLPTSDGGTVRPDRLIRADNLQGLTDADVRTLVDTHDVRAVVDLRTGVEVRAEGPGPMLREPAVVVEHRSLFPETGGTTDAADAEDGAVVLPWQNRAEPTSDEERRHGAAGVYLSYLDDRADSIVASLRTIAGSPGATIVHCAAGKDRTGVVVAFALAEVGVTDEAIVADYALTAERIEAIFARLAASPTYANEVVERSIDEHTPKAQTMEGLLGAVGELHGGVPAWLRSHGWTEDDAAALRAKLLG